MAIYYFTKIHRLVKKSMWNNKFLILGSLLRFFMENRGGNRENRIIPYSFTLLKCLIIISTRLNKTPQHLDRVGISPDKWPQRWIPVVLHQRADAKDRFLKRKKGSLHNWKEDTIISSSLSFKLTAKECSAKNIRHHKFSAAVEEL